VAVKPRLDTRNKGLIQSRVSHLTPIEAELVDSLDDVRITPRVSRTFVFRSTRRHPDECCMLLFMQTLLVVDEAQFVGESLLRLWQRVKQEPSSTLVAAVRHAHPRHARSFQPLPSLPYAH
jgi:thymidine kinase